MGLYEELLPFNSIELTRYVLQLVVYVSVSRELFQHLPDDILFDIRQRQHIEELSVHALSVREFSLELFQCFEMRVFTLSVDHLNGGPFSNQVNSIY